VVDQIVIEQLIKPGGQACTGHTRTIRPGTAPAMLAPAT
jgi:hypothetical protein